MITTNDKLVEVLNDLVEINNDRIVGYEKAADETKSVDVDLQAIFHKMADESRKYKSELVEEVTRLGGEPSTGTTNSGKLYRVWMDAKAIFTGKDRQAILENCEFGEDAAQKAYKLALASDAAQLEMVPAPVTVRNQQLNRNFTALSRTVARGSVSPHNS